MTSFLGHLLRAPRLVTRQMGASARSIIGTMIIALPLGASSAQSAGLRDAVLADPVMMALEDGLARGFGCRNLIRPQTGLESPVRVFVEASGRSPSDLIVTLDCHSYVLASARLQFRHVVLGDQFEGLHPGTLESIRFEYADSLEWYLENEIGSVTPRDDVAVTSHPFIKALRQGFGS